MPFYDFVVPPHIRKATVSWAVLDIQVFTRWLEGRAGMEVILGPGLGLL